MVNSYSGLVNNRYFMSVLCTAVAARGVTDLMGGDQITHFILENYL